MARIILIVIFLGGCFFDTSADIPFGVQTQSKSDDIPTTLFDPEEVPTGMVCVHDFAEGAVCDPVLQDCGEGYYCDLAFDTRVKRARAVCKLRPEKLEGTHGEKCNAGICSEGFFCVSGSCRRFCELNSGFGCEEDQFCDDPFVGTHGVCMPSCR